MELKGATITVKKKEKSERKKKGKMDRGKEIKKEKAITDCNDSVIWQHSQQPCDNHKINSENKFAIHSHFRELMSSKS